MKIMLSCLLLCICTSLFSQDYEWYIKEQQQKQLSELDKESPLVDHYYHRLYKSGRKLKTAGSFIFVGMAAAFTPLLYPGEPNIVIGSVVVGTLSTIVVAVNLVDAGTNLKIAGKLLRDHHLQLQLEATKNGIGMVMRF